jgi:hypothetical protein
MLDGYNSQWIARLMRQKTDAALSTTSLGQIGDLKLSPRIVIRLEPKEGSAPPEYLREASYRIYRSSKQTWHAGDLRNEFESQQAEPDGTTWILLAGKTNTSAVNIACYLNGWSRDLDAPDGLLPLPTGSGRLENLPVFPLKTSRNGSVLAGGLGFVIFDARYGPGATIDSPPASTNFDFDVPTNEIPALDRVISEMNISGATDEQKLRAVQKFFAGKFTYSTWQGADKLAGTRDRVGPLSAQQSQRPLRILRDGHGPVVAAVENSGALCGRLRRPREIRPRLRGARARRARVVSRVGRTGQNLGGF